MKRIAALFLPALAALALACPALAVESASESAAPARPAALYPSEVVESGDGDHKRLEKIYLLTAADDPAHIPTEAFDREGWRYTLLDVTRQDYTESDVKEHIETVTLDSGTKEMDQIMPQLAATREVTTEDGYTGVLTLDTTTIKVEAAGHGTSSHAVSATRSYPNLSDADAVLIPKSITDNGRTLTLADIQWQEAGGFYNATATYSGTATSRYVTGYTVTAEYVGEVVKTLNGQMVYTAIFSGAPIHPTALEKPEENSGMETPPSGLTEDSASDARPAGGSGLYWLLLLPVGAGAAGLALLGKKLLKKYKAKKDWSEYTK